MTDGAAAVERPPRAAPPVPAQTRTITRLRRLPRPGWIVVATLIYTLLAIQLTWPLARDLDSRIFGSFGDLTGGMAVLREMVDDGDNPFLPGKIENFSAPDGRDIEWPQNVGSFGSTAMLYGLAVLFGAVPAFSLFTLGGYVLTGAVTFAFVRKLTGNPWIALLAGWAYAFSPFAVMKGAGHVHFVHGWVFVLVLWRMLALYERPTLRNGAIAGVVTVLAMSFSPYHLLFAGLEWATLLAVCLALPLLRRTGDFRRHLRAQATGAAIVLVFAAGLAAAASFSAQGTGAEDRTLDALTVYAARPFEYLVPHATHPIWGDDVAGFRADRIHGSNPSETQLYVGWSLILLSLVALVAAARRRLEPRLSTAVLAVAAMGMVALLWSAPPKVAAFGHLIPFPSLLTYEISPAWRVYSRLVMVAMLAVVVLGSIGLHRLLRGRPLALRALLFVAIAAVVVVDLRADPLGTNPLGDARSLKLLSKLPDGIVANYPLEPAGFGDYSAEFIQRQHGKPIINGYEKGSMAERRALQLDDLESPRTPGRLAALGVRYVVIDNVPIGDGVQDPGRPGRGLRFITDDGHHSIWSVAARPLPMVTMGPGFGELEIGPNRLTHRWLVSNEGKIELLGDCSVCRGTLSVDAESFAGARSVSLVRSDGSVMSTRVIPAQKRRVSFPVDFRHRETVTVRTSPGPVRAGADPRRLSVSFTRPRLALR